MRDNIAVLIDVTLYNAIKENPLMYWKFNLIQFEFI